MNSGSEWLTAVATAVAAIGTVGTLIAALWQIHSERKRRLQQEAADREERHQDQARLVAAWTGMQLPYSDAQTTRVIAINGSAEPIYNVVAWVVYIQGAAPRTGEQWQSQQGVSRPPYLIASILPPGRWRLVMHQGGWGILSGRIGAEVAFTDRNGAHWIRRATGALEEISKGPMEHYGLPAPFDFFTPEPDV